MSSEFQISDEELDMVLANSYKDFHAKGLDYICTWRYGNGIRTKYYFFDGDHTKLPEVVNPHNHRYDFHSWVLAGDVVDHRYNRVRTGGDMYNTFNWYTPLNGGSGFTWSGTDRLSLSKSRRIEKGLMSSHSHIHTIQIKADQTVLALTQYPDALPLDEPTQLYTFGEAAPNTSGLYNQFTPDEALARLKQINDLLKG